jgi:branched-subunit amino acid aminotransferase/4-amino-4-deoxychorismate lyase
MTAVLINGRPVKPAEARVPVFDAGFMHGVGLFETMLAVKGRVLFLREHAERLVESARQLHLSLTLDPEALMKDAARAADELDAPRSRVRLTVTGGDLNLLARKLADHSREPETRPLDDDPAAKPIVIAVAQPASDYPREWFTSGVTVRIADWRTNPLDPTAGHKTLNYWTRLRELQRAAARRAAEALVFQVTNYLAGGCVSNALLIKGPQLLTPIARGEEAQAAPTADPDQPSSAAVLPSPVLPGVVRAWALAWALNRGMHIDRRMLTIDDVLSADEIILTNSAWGALPVVNVEQKRIGGGAVGPVAGMLREEWERLTA